MTCCRSVTILFFVCTLAGCGGGGGEPGAAAPGVAYPQPSVVTGSVPWVVGAAVDSGVDGAFAYVERRGSVTVAARGVQDRGDAVPADPDALFKIASLSKLFIAVSVTQLAHQGQLSLDDTIATWLPALAGRIENADVITVRQLVRHRSGVPDFDSEPGFSWQNAHTSTFDTLAFALDQPADFAPDARFAYSNTNYVLLALILDEALGFSHQMWIEEFILARLGLANTFYVLDDAPRERLVRGYWDGRETTFIDYAIPGGSMVSTLRDVGVFTRSLATGQLLSDEERALYRGLYWFEHSGWVPGFQSRTAWVEDLDAVVVLFINNTGGGSEDVLSTTFDNLVLVTREE